MLRLRYNLFFSLVVTVFSAATFSSCIKNETPMTDIKGVFIEFEAEGEIKATISTANRTVVVDLLETTDPKSVRILKMVLPEGGTCDLPEVVDLTSPVKTIIKTYAEYEWTISATQTIERILTLGEDQQVGEAYFEENSKSAFVHVKAGTDMANIAVETLKLGPAGQTVMTPDLNGKTVSFKDSSVGGGARVRTVAVAYRDVEETWSIHVAETETTINPVNKSDAWATFASVSASVIETNIEAVEFAYRKSGEEDWIYVTGASDANYGYSAKLTGLTPATEYEACLFIDGEFVGDSVTFTTEPAPALENGDLEGWQKPGKPWLVYAKDTKQYWDTGNHGATTISSEGSVTIPSSDVRPGSAGVYSAYLESTFVGILGFGKFAAGNLFYGEYAGTFGVNGKVDFGQPFTSRPSALKCWYKAHAGTVDESGGGGLVKGDTDKYRIFVALTDWGERRQIYTADHDTFIDWDNDPGIIAFGELISSASVTDWTELAIKLKYRSLDRVPTHLVIVGSASMLGDYFTGSTSSWMYLDDFELIYNSDIVTED